MGQRQRVHPESKDPLIGTQNPAESIFVIPQGDGGPPIEVKDLSSFTTTKAVAYVFLPSITAIKFIADVCEDAYRAVAPAKLVGLLDGEAEGPHRRA